MQVISRTGPRPKKRASRKGARFELFEYGIARQPSSRPKKDRRYRYVLVDHWNHRVVGYFALKRTAERTSGLKVSKRKFPPRWMAE